MLTRLRFWLIRRLAGRYPVVLNVQLASLACRFQEPALIDALPYGADFIRLEDR
jgi:hypothetical protein